MLHTTPYIWPEYLGQKGVSLGLLHQQDEGGGEDRDVTIHAVKVCTCQEGIQAIRLRSQPAKFVQVVYKEVQSTFYVPECKAHLEKEIACFSARIKQPVL